MNGYVTIALVLFCVLNNFHNVSCDEKDDQCGAVEEKPSPTALRLNIVSRRNSTGNSTWNWVTQFQAHRDDSEEDNEMAVDVFQDVVDCGGRRKVTLRGKIIGLQLPEGDSKTFGVERLRLHPRSGSNSAVINGGRTAEKISMTDVGYGSTFTNRPLKDDELFEVVLERKTNHFSYSLGIGVTPHSPVYMSIPKHIHHMPEPNWSYYYSVLYYNNGVAKRKYGQLLDSLQVGDRVGVMRRSNGSLHYFVNGEDQGVAATDLPGQVYGVIELYANAARVSIV